MEAEFQVYSPEVDDRGIDLIARFANNPFLAIQVKSVRQLGYVFMQKSKFILSDDLYLALGLLFEEQAPQLFLIPSRTWETPNTCFASRDYGDGKASAPEWGINLSERNMPLLEPFRFHTVIAKIAPTIKAASAL